MASHYGTKKPNNTGSENNSYTAAKEIKTYSLAGMNDKYIGEVGTTATDYKYRAKKLLDWERKSLAGKFQNFSFSKKSTWMTAALIIFGLPVFGLIFPFIPPRHVWSNWTPPTTTVEYQHRLTNYLVMLPILIFATFAYGWIRNKIDLSLGTKRVANFKVTNVYSLGTIKILLMNRWRPFSIRAIQPYFNSIAQGQVITIKRTGTYRLIDYYIPDVT